MSNKTLSNIPTVLEPKNSKFHIGIIYHRSTYYILSLNLFSVFSSSCNFQKLTRSLNLGKRMQNRSKYNYSVFQIMTKKSVTWNHKNQHVWMFITLPEIDNLAVGRFSFCLSWICAARMGLVANDDKQCILLCIDVTFQLVKASINRSWVDVFLNSFLSKMVELS